MKKTMKKYLKIVALPILLASGSTSNAAVIELALLLDGSGSVGSSGWTSQINAYENIFKDDFYDNYMTAGDTLHVRAYQFSTNVYAETSWFTITDNASAWSFGDEFDFGWRRGWTRTNLATDFAVNDLLSNAFDGDRLIIDVSTDGNPYYTSGSLQAESVVAAATAASQGVTVNAIGIGSGISETFLDQYSAAGNGAYWIAQDFAAFQTSLEDKLYTEINEVPEPSTLALMALGLASLVVRRRKS